jgi:hypothetical protein
MSDKYIPAVGHMVRQPQWADAYAMEVTAVGRTKFFSLTFNGSDEQSWKLDDEWVQVVKPEPLTEAWVALRADGGTWRPSGATSFATAVAKCQQVWGGPPVAVVHIWTDAGVDHVELERVTS